MSSYLDLKIPTNITETPGSAFAIHCHMVSLLYLKGR